MKTKQFVALTLASLMCLSVAACNAKPDSTSAASSVSSSTSVPVVTSDSETFESTEGTDEEFTEFYSLENMSAADIKTTLEKYYTEIIPSGGQSSDAFRKGLPKVPERIVNGMPENKCFVSYKGLDTSGHSRIIIITWEGIIENDAGDTFEITDVHAPKTTFDIVLF